MDKDVLPTEEELLDAKKQAFRKFMQLPASKLLLSLIPKSEHPDLLETTLQSALESGFDSGYVTGIAHIASKVFANKK